MPRPVGQFVRQCGRVGFGISKRLEGGHSHIVSIDGVERLRQLVKKIGSELDQESMYFEVAAGSSAELVRSKARKSRNPRKGGK